MESGAPVDRLSRFLSAFSLAFGTAQLAAPNVVNRLAGIRDDPTSRLWQRLVGVREVVAFAAIEAEQPRPRRALWMRVAGDAKDLTLLALAWRGRRASTPRLAGAIASVAGIAALDAHAAARAGRAPENERTEEEPMHVKAAITVRKPREEVYRFWRDLENLPSFMNHVESIEGNGNGRSHWKVKAPAGTHVEWDAEVVEDRPGEALVWRAVEGSGVQNAGAVRFVDAPRDQGTEVHVEFDYGAPGGRLGEAVAKLFGEEPTQQAKDDLRRFKQVLETGFVVRSEGSPEGSTARRHLKQRPGQPVEDGGPGEQEPKPSIERAPSVESAPSAEEGDQS